MIFYRLSGQDFFFDQLIPELAPFEITWADSLPEIEPISPPAEMYAKTQGWGGGAQREVESWYAPPVFCLRLREEVIFILHLAGGQLCATVRKSEQAPGTDNLHC